MVWWLVAWLYLMGAAMMWWWTRARGDNVAAKVIAVVFWPVIVPIAAFV